MKPKPSELQHSDFIDVCPECGGSGKIIKNTRPKPSVKWPERKICLNPRTVSGGFDYPELVDCGNCEGCKVNQTIDTCQAACAEFSLSKLSVKWPGKKKLCRDTWHGGGQDYTPPFPRSCPSCQGIHSNFQIACDEEFNKAIDACQAAVDEAGLEYGLDEIKLRTFIGDLIANENLSFQITGGHPQDMLHYVAHAIKLAERKLIVRKEK